jgi:hypothetical protein
VAGRGEEAKRGPYEAIGRDRRRLPDLAPIDGCFRRACALATARRAGIGNARVTLFFDDDADRDDDHDIEQHLGAPRMSGRAAIFERDGAALDVSQSLVDAAITDPR